MSTPLEKWVEEVARLTKPDRIWWCDGSDEEARRIMEAGMKEEKIEGKPVFYELNQANWPMPIFIGAIPQMWRGPNI